MTELTILMIKPAVAMLFLAILCCFRPKTMPTMAAGRERRGNQKRKILAIPKTKLIIPKVFSEFLGEDFAIDFFLAIR